MVPEKNAAAGRDRFDRRADDRLSSAAPFAAAQCAARAATQRFEKQEDAVARIPLISADGDLSADQRRVVEALLGRRGGRIPGPYRLSLHCPELTEAWHPLGETLRLKSKFPLRVSELVIVLAARAWDCQYVFHAHSKLAIEGGIAPAVIEALAAGDRPVFTQPDEEVVYDYCMELFDRHVVSDATYQRALDLFKAAGMVELTALFGYYTMVSMTMAAHQMEVPGDARVLKARKRS
jgi:4-carboxymuconolactone decarboxylase